MPDTCSHVDAITEITQSRRRECEECVKMGARWVHLRTCQSCGATLCCDSSPNLTRARPRALVSIQTLQELANGGGDVTVLDIHRVIHRAHVPF